MADYRSTAEWEQVLAGILSFLRTHASQELEIAAVMRLERNAWRRAQEILNGLEVMDEGPLATDELLAGAVSPGGRQDVTEQVLRAATRQSVEAPNAAEPTFSPEAELEGVDDGPEGVADDANRELSEEVYEEHGLAESLDTAELDLEDEEDEDMATAAPATMTPLSGDERAREPYPGEDTQTFEGELDLDAMEPEAIELDELEEIEAEPLDTEPGPLEALGDDKADEAAAEDGDGPLLPDFDFDDEEEQDETVVFAMGAGQTGEEIARLLDEKTDAHNAIPAAQADGDGGFDLMPDLGDDLELEELDEIELDFDDDEGEDEQTVLDPGLDIELDEPVHTPEPAPLPIQTRRGGAQTPAPSGPRVAAGLYANPNVPTVREGRSPAPRAAAIAINAQAGTGKVMGFEEEEEALEIGSAEDYGEEEDDLPPGRSGGGFSLDIQEYESEEYEEEEEEDEEPPPAPAPPPKPVFRGPDAGQIAAVLERAQEAAAKGDMQAGVDLFSDVLDADPDNVDAYVGRGRLYLDLGDYSRSMSDFITAEDIAPNSPEPQVAIGDLYFARKDYRKAIDYFNGALEMDGQHAMAHCRRGISHYYRKNYQDALADLKTAETLNRDIPNIGTYISMARKKAKK